MKTHNFIRLEYNLETGRSVYRVTNDKTLVYDEEYVHWLERNKIANDANVLYEDNPKLDSPISKKNLTN